jgi:hypothetical protein
LRDNEYSYEQQQQMDQNTTKIGEQPSQPQDEKNANVRPKHIDFLFFAFNPRVFLKRQKMFSCCYVGLVR